MTKIEQKMRSPVNLLEETTVWLKSYGHAPDEVLWVGSVDGKFAMSWDEFAKIADYTYDCGYTWSNNINEKLVVVGTDWWMSRRVGIEGCEMWQYNSYPERHENARPFNTVTPIQPHDVWFDKTLVIPEPTESDNQS